MSLHVYIHVGMEKAAPEKKADRGSSCSYIKLDSVIQSTFIVIIIKST